MFSHVNFFDKCEERLHKHEICFTLGRAASSGRSGKAMTQSGLSGRRVLVVEGESRIAMLVRDILEDMGCEVVTASRLGDARQKAASLAFDVALLDIDLDGQPSFRLADELAARGIPFVLATGYRASKIPPEFKQVPVLQKPFLRAELERVLLTALAAGEER